MALKIRLRQQGRNNLASYRLVVTDVRYPRDGKYVEALGWYNPVESNEDKQFNVLPDRVQHWLDLGAQLTEGAEALLLRAQPNIVRTHKEKVLAQKAKLRDKRKAARREGASKKG